MEERLYHAVTMGRFTDSADNRAKHADGNYVCAERVKRISTLEREYLCMGKDSPCATFGECVCLDVCLYGQRYIELKTKEENENDGVRREN